MEVPPSQEPAGAVEQGDPSAMSSRTQVVALTQELARRMVALAGDLSAATGLNPSDLAALRALDAAAGDGMAVNALGAHLGLSSGAITALVDRLEHHALVQRTRDPHDRRRVLVTPAPKARAFGAEHLMPLMQAIQQGTAALGVAELAAVQRYLEIVLGHHAATSDDQPTASGG